MARARKKTRTTRQPGSLAEEHARRIASRIPFVHFPVAADLATVASWGELLSAQARGADVYDGTDPRQMRRQHVFVYAGPSCFGGGDDELGHVLLVFSPSSDRQGAACPFDTGALLELNPRLQPYAAQRESGQMSDADAIAFVGQQSVPMRSFRGALERWLASSYDRPEQYLDASMHRYADGEPQRLPLQELLEHNGTRGLRRRVRCADRRAWTWELRFENALPFEDLAAIVTSESHFQEALQTFPDVEMRVLPEGELPGGDAFYRYSGTMLLTWTREGEP